MGDLHLQRYGDAEAVVLWVRAVEAGCGEELWWPKLAHAEALVVAAEGSRNQIAEHQQNLLLRRQRLAYTQRDPRLHIRGGRLVEPYASNAARRIERVCVGPTVVPLGKVGLPLILPNGPTCKALVVEELELAGRRVAQSLPRQQVAHGRGAALLHTRNDDERHGPGLGHAEPSLRVGMTANIQRLGEAGARGEDRSGPCEDARGSPHCRSQQGRYKLTGVPVTDKSSEEHWTQRVSAQSLPLAGPPGTETGVSK